MSFYIASSPHQHIRRSTHHVMRWVLLAMVPGVLAQLYFFGWGVLFQLAFAVGVALLAEASALFLRHRPIKPALNDYSAIVTAALLAVSIPPLAPWWVILIGTLFAILVVKHMFGGIGQNIFNPAMAAYVMLLVSFPVQMTSWMPPAVAGYQAPDFIDSLWLFFSTFTSEGYSLEQVRLVWSASGLDAMAMATPLDHIKTEVGRGYTLGETMQSDIFSWFAGAGWQWVNLAFLVGGIVLLLQRIITWHIPLGLLSSLGLCAIIGALTAPDLLPGFNIHLLSGGTMLAAFFIATDPVSAATSNKGKLVYAALIGLLIYIIRTWGGYPDAVAFAVLLANLCVPVIDQYTRPQAYGHGGTRT